MTDIDAKTAALTALAAKIRRLERAETTIGPRRTHGFGFGVPEMDGPLADTGFPFAGHHEVHGKATAADFAVTNAFMAFVASKLSGGVLAKANLTHQQFLQLDSRLTKFSFFMRAATKWR